MTETIREHFNVRDECFGNIDERRRDTPSRQQGFVAALAEDAGQREAAVLAEEPFALAAARHRARTGRKWPLFSLSHRLDHAAQCAVAQKDGVEECGAGMDEGEDDEDGFAERMDLAKVPDVEIG